jgi:hypothetical protein
MADPTMPLSDWVEKIKESILPTENIDMALLVLKSTDYRIDSAQILCLRAMKIFLDNLKPKNTFIVFTHCDENKPDEKFLIAKLASMKKYGKLEIP